MYMSDLSVVTKEKRSNEIRKHQAQGHINVLYECVDCKNKGSSADENETIHPKSTMSRD